MTKIIAELCQNHNGDLKILEEMVHAAAESGADRDGGYDPDRVLDDLESQLGE